MAVFGGTEVIEICSSSDDERSTADGPRTTSGKDLLKQFISVCKPLLKMTQQKAITKLLMDKFDEARTDYTQSADFRNFVQQHISELQMKQKSVYVHIQDVKTALMRMSDTPKVTLNTVKVEKKEDAAPVMKEEGQQPGDCGAGVDGEGSGETQLRDAPSTPLEMTCETIKSEDAADDLSEMRAEDVQDVKIGNADMVVSSLDAEAGPSSSFHNTGVDTNNTLDNATTSIKIPGTMDSDRQTVKKEKGKGSKKQIRKLERVLGRLDKAIKRLQERELTLDEMDECDSTHIQEYQLRRRFVKVYNMLCKLYGCSESTGRVIEQRIHYEGTRFPEINRRLERLVNRRDFFPDFHDVYTAVYKTNLKKNLGLDKKKVNSIAQEAFEDIGRKLQKRRQQDFVLNFSSHSTLNFVAARDLADDDPELKRKLSENKAVAKQKIEKVEDDFVRRQEECERRGVNLEASEHSESDVPSDGPSDNEEDEDRENGPAAKIMRLNDDEYHKGNEENGGENGRESIERDDREKDCEREGSTTMGFRSADPSSNDAFPVQTQQSLPNQTMQEQLSNASKPETNALTENSSPHVVPTYTCTYANGANDPRLTLFGVPHSDPLEKFTNGWAGNIHDKGGCGHTDLEATAVDSSPLPPTLVPCTKSPLPSFDTPEEAVESLNITPPPVPSAAMPLVITNVRSLSPHARWFSRPHNTAWDQGKATIAQVVDDGEGRFLIGPPRQQKITLLQSGKTVKLQTSSPITLSFEDSPIDASDVPPPAKSPPPPSPPPSVSSTQPELDASPDVEEVVVVSVGNSLLEHTEERLVTATTADPTSGKVTHMQHQSKAQTTYAMKTVVSKNSRVYTSASSSHCKQTVQEALNPDRKQFCVQSTHISNSGSGRHPPNTSCRTGAVHVGRVRGESAMPVHPRTLTKATGAAGPSGNVHPFLKQQPAEDRIFRLKHIPRIIPKINMSPQRRSKPQQNGRATGALTAEKSCPQKLKFTSLNTVTNVKTDNDNDDKDSDVVIISDSESETKENSQNRAESPEVICISDSD